MFDCLYPCLLVCSFVRLSVLLFQRYKLERYFDLLDFDNNQRVNMKDLVLWGERAAACYEEAGIHVSEEKLKDMRKLLGKYIYMYLRTYIIVGTV